MPETITGNMPTGDSTVQTAPVVPQAAPQAVPQFVPQEQPQFVPQPTYVQPVTQPVPQVAVSPDNDRTRNQFEKLLESNSELFKANEVLRQELLKRSETNQQPQTPQLPPVQAPARQVPADSQDLYETDPITGEYFVSADKLKARMEEMNERATRAERIASQIAQTTEQREIERQNRETFVTYPELNPDAKDKFDSKFATQTRAVIYDSLINPQDYGGRPLGFKEAADFARAQYQGTTTMQGQQQSSSDQQSQSAQTFKQQASAGVTGQQPMERTNAGSEVDFETLRLKTRLGDRTALAQRIFAAEQAAKGEAS